MKKKSLKLGYHLSMAKGATLQPTRVEFWKDEASFQRFTPTEPFKYMADALVGLSLLKLNHYIKSPMQTPHLDYPMVQEAWAALDPHVELYERSHQRTRALQSQIAVVNPQVVKEFESHFNETFEMCVKPWGMDLTALWPLLDTFTWLENKMQAPLLYNFGLNFSKPFIEKMHTLYSFLYHLRSLVAVDHNAHCEDPSHDGVKVDAILDYLPRAEYVVNDALLYWNFQKWARPLIADSKHESTVQKNLVNPMMKSFHKLSHNACYLVDHLPTQFLNSLNPLELEEALHLVQMDWLLGSPAGILFKIREEIYGLQSGYEKIFWKDCEPQSHKKEVQLSLCCEVKYEHFSGKKSA